MTLPKSAREHVSASGVRAAVKFTAAELKLIGWALKVAADWEEAQSFDDDKTKREAYQHHRTSRRMRDLRHRIEAEREASR